MMGGGGIGRLGRGEGVVVAAFLVIFRFVFVVCDDYGFILSRYGAYSRIWVFVCFFGKLGTNGRGYLLGIMGWNSVVCESVCVYL